MQPDADQAENKPLEARATFQIEPSLRASVDGIEGPGKDSLLENSTIQYTVTVKTFAQSQLNRHQDGQGRP